MSYYEQLVSEIDKILDELSERGDVWNATWIAHHICSTHDSGLSNDDDSLFWRHCGYTTSREMVRKRINSKVGDNEKDDGDQMKLPGWQHLQAHYLVNRNGEDIGVRIDLMTEAELEEKAKHKRAMGAACYAHADELDRYRNMQFTKQVSLA